MEGVILRNPGACRPVRHDLVIVGGGVYGVALTLEAARRGAKPLLLERGDFGAETSWNSLRIVHGGLRYLQSLDLPRFRESVGERSRFLREFPDLVFPLPCLMPLYGKGLRRPTVLRAALAANDLLSFRRNTGVDPDRTIRGGRVIDRDATIAAFPRVDAEGLRGAAMWYDAVMPDSQRLLIEMLRWATSAGAHALNYVEAVGLIQEDGHAGGVRAVDRLTGQTHDYRGAHVVNCAGPWCREVAARFDRDVSELLHPSLAFNALIDREPVSDCAVAVEPRRPGARTYFLHPWKRRIFAGTFHAPWSGPPDAPEPPPEAAREFLDDLNAAIPGLGIRPDDVIRWNAGLLPAAEPGTEQLARHPVIHDHGRSGGPKGLVSVSGVKWTTSRDVAEKTLSRIWGDLPEPRAPRPAPRELPTARELAILLDNDPQRVQQIVDLLVAEEAVIRKDDLLLRRTGWGADPEDGERLRREIGNRVESASAEIRP